MAETNQNLWSPWRMEYIRGLHDTGRKEKCFFCHHWRHPEQDRQNHVLWRTENAFAVLNKFPYTGGHLLVAPGAHGGDMQEIPTPVLSELMQLLKDAHKLLREVVKAEGFNIGMNFGRCAGAGIPDHLHSHIVPRWRGDTNFMPVFSDVRIIPVMLEDLYEALAEAAPRLGLPPLAGAKP